MLTLSRRLLVCRPYQGVPDQTLKSGMIVDGAVMTQSDARDARFGVLDNENHGKGFVFGRRVGDGEDLDRSALGIRFEPIELVLHREFGRQTAHEWVAGIRYGDFKFSVAIMAARTSTT